MFTEMRIKTYYCCTMLLINNSTKVFKKAEYVIIITKYKLLGLFIGVYSVVFTITYIIYLLGYCYLAVLYKLYYIETLTLLTLIVLYFTKFIDKNLSVAV